MKRSVIQLCYLLTIGILRYGIAAPKIKDCKDKSTVAPTVDTKTPVQSNITVPPRCLMKDVLEGVPIETLQPVIVKQPLPCEIQKYINAEAKLQSGYEDIGFEEKVCICATCFTVTGLLKPTICLLFG